MKASTLIAALALSLPPAMSFAQAQPVVAPDAPADQTMVEPEAREALEKMSRYLGTLRTFEIQTKTSIDLVTEEGQRIQLDGDAHYKVRRPDGFIISVNTDWKKRTYYYDGKQFTIYAPEQGFYSTAAAPSTILQTLDVIWEKFGLALPVEDLFRWAEVGSRRAEALDSAFHVGTVTIDGAPTDHYAYRQGEVDWQIWIQQGERPLPLKLAIIDRTDLAQPAYVANLKWTLTPTFGPDEFAFRPAAGAKPIRLTAAGSRRLP